MAIKKVRVCIEPEVLFEGYPYQNWVLPRLIFEAANEANKSGLDGLRLQTLGIEENPHSLTCLKEFYLVMVFDEVLPGIAPVVELSCGMD